MQKVVVEVAYAYGLVTAFDQRNLSVNRAALFSPEVQHPVDIRSRPTMVSSQSVLNPVRLSPMSAGSISRMMTTT